MPTINLGKIGMVLRGEYSATTSYEKLDVVTYEGSSFVAKVATAGNTPNADGTDTTFWQCIAKRGEEINGELARAAAEAANKAAGAATKAAQEAENTRNLIDDAVTAASRWENVSVAIEMLPAGSTPSATTSDIQNGKKMDFKLPKGDTGATPNITIGSVTSVAPTAPAKVTKSGTAENPVFSFEIPIGESGGVSTVNGVSPDKNGNVELEIGDGSVQSVNGVLPDESGNVELEIGGRNLLRDSGRYYSAMTSLGGGYELSNYTLSGKNKPRQNDTVTIQIAATINNESAYLDICNTTSSGSMVTLSNLDKSEKGIYTSTFKWRESGGNTSLVIFVRGSVGASSATVSWVKLEYGSVATDWTPAPEDKQDKLTGTAGQVVGFDKNGNAVAGEIGGRNYLISPTAVAASNASWSYDSGNGMYTLVKGQSATSWGQIYFTGAIPDIENLKNKKITISLSNVYCSDPNANWAVFFRATNAVGSTTTIGSATDSTFYKEDGVLSKTFEFDSSILDDIKDSYLLLRIDQNKTSPVGTVFKVCVKVEVGDIATDWSPALEDLTNPSQLVIPYWRANGFTIADLRSQLDGLFANASSTRGILTAIRMNISGNWTTLWNSNDTTTVLSAGSGWTFTLISSFDNSSYCTFLVSTYGSNALYLVRKSGGTWQPLVTIPTTSTANISYGNQLITKDDLTDIELAMVELYESKN